MIGRAESNDSNNEDVAYVKTNTFTMIIRVAILHLLSVWATVYATSICDFQLQIHRTLMLSHNQDALGYNTRSKNESLWILQMQIIYLFIYFIIYFFFS